eukprot:Gregarina_sp_Poly_1__7795@NODE_440_length_8372_cov_344_424925_g359_i0_p3_GENE_NODE_440_length_8372_cov_344_424925_g359_i0NODE_440_length_8372_cov_344_424925_g359_i0_p3_ORF_typecomplete_len446_score53_96Nucleoside_tran/PF01733_18/2_7e03Nucleoside_tran/PF01733_18/1_4e41MFS_2/PF13347_6/0_17MFS_2/PF13347_6/0_26MFS_2/PF13347_6/0_59UL41A/PF17591_2/0_12VirB8/PF04335_13/0_19TMIE/PF16038_5/0_41_NODE_440_length_8372_cov_344_424925_g359_i027724109
MSTSSGSLYRHPQPPVVVDQGVATHEQETVALNVEASLKGSRDIEAYKGNADADMIERLAPDTDTIAQFSWLYLLIFIFIGTSHLTFWNGILNVLGDVRTVYFESQPSAADTLTAAQTTGVLIAAIANSLYGKISIKIFLIAATIQAIVHLLTPAVLYAPSEPARAALLHVLYFISGLSNGGYQSIGYAISGAMPYVYTGAVSAGNGFSGLLTFAVWMILKATDAGALMRNLWWLMGIGCFVVTASIVVVMMLWRRPEVRAKIDADNATMAAARNDPTAPSYISLLKETWPMVVTVFLTFLLTLSLFPNVGPIRWSGTGSQLDTVLGMFQVGDFIGRLMPNLTWLILPPLWVYITAGARFIFLVFFILFWQKSASNPWDSFAFQAIIMLLFAVTNGWMSSCSVIHAPLMTNHLAYRGKVATMALVGLLLGITLGSWLSKLIVLGS